MKRRVAVLLFLLIAAAGAAWWFDAPSRYFGWRKAGENRLTLYGNVDIRQVQLGLRVAGRLAELKFDEGQEVKTGDVLARLDEKPLQAGVRAAEAQVKGQEAILAKLEAGPRPAEIAQARAAVAERKADLDNAKQAFERADRLRLSGSSAQAIVDQAQAQRDMSEARLASANEALKLLQEGSRPEDIAGARANLENARANLASAQTSLADATLLAPSDGIVLSRVKEPGAIVAPNDIVYVLSLIKPVWVRAYIAEPSLGRVHPGMEVQVVTDTRREPYRGRVGFISPVAEFTPKTVQTPELRADLVYRMRIIVEDTDDKLRQGMPVTVHLPDAAAAR